MEVLIRLFLLSCPTRPWIPRPLLSCTATKDLIEKAFGDLKERLIIRRTFVSSEQRMQAVRGVHRPDLPVLHKEANAGCRLVQELHSAGASGQFQCDRML